MIDQVREESSTFHPVDESASARQLRRRMLRMTLERNVSMDEKRRKMGDVHHHRSSSTSEASISGGVAKKKSSTVHNHRSTPSLLQSPPPPPTTTPSYRTIVTHLITQNEPEKLPQIDRVMQKYLGREEELITKLDLRYRKKKKRRGGGEGSSRSEGGQISMEGGNDDGACSARIGKTEQVISKEMSVDNEVDAVAVAIIGKESPKKDRSAIQMMQSWNRKHTEEEEEVPPEPLDIKNVETSTATMPKKEDQVVEVIDPDLKLSTRTDSTRTELHSNTEKIDDIDEEGRLPKVPETTTMRLTSTPTRPVENKSSTQNSPAFNDDISLITMETKETLFRNKGEMAAVYSFAEMTRRPPASIIVDGGGGSGSPQRGGGNSSASGENLEEVGQVTQTQTQKQQLVPPKIQRLLPQYESEKAKAAEASSEAAAKLDSVEARILARRQLREEAALASESDEIPLPARRDEMKATEENSTMAFDEEESFVGKSKSVEAPAVPSEVLENSFSLIDSEAKQRDNIDNGADGKVEARECVAVEEEKLDVTLIRDNTKSSLDRLGEDNIDPSMDGPDTCIVINEENDTKQQDAKLKSVPAPMSEEDIPLDELNASIRQSNVGDEDEKPLDVTNVTEQSYVTCIQSPEVVTKSLGAARAASSPLDMPDDEIGNIVESQDQKQENKSVTASTSRDTEIQLKAMEDEIARLIAEKESRFAAEKAVALKKAEQALEEVRICCAN